MPVTEAQRLDIAKLRLTQCQESLEAAYRVFIKEYQQVEAFRSFFVKLHVTTLQVTKLISALRANNLTSVIDSLGRLNARLNSLYNESRELGFPSLNAMRAYLYTAKNLASQATDQLITVQESRAAA